MIEVREGQLINPAFLRNVRKDTFDGEYSLVIMYDDTSISHINYGGDFVHRNKVYREFQKYE